MDIITKIASSELQLIARILDYLTLEDLIRIDFVCNTWREILEASFKPKYSMLMTDVGDGSNHHKVTNMMFSSLL